jgi:general secretion pathway protein C
MNAVSWFDGLATPDKWRGSLHARAPQFAVWVLAIAMGVQAAIIVTNFAGTADEPSLSNAQSAAPVVQPPRRANVAAIANSHIFGAPAPPEQPPQDASNAPPSSMALVLTGIISNEDPQNGLAILGESAAAAKVYGVGDNVPGGARLHSVYSDRVLLERDGRLESLALPRQVMAGLTEAPPPPGPPPIANSPQEPMAERMRRLIAEEPGVIADVMRPQAVFAQGKQRGYRVYPGRNRQAFQRLGLKPGDLVVSINGTPLDDPARGQEIFRTIGSSSEAHVTVMRNGRQQDLTLNMSQVASEAESLVGGGEGNMAPADQQPQMPPPPDSSGND